MSPTGYEVGMYRDIERIANALERIANALEEHAYGLTGPDLARLKADLLASAGAGEAKR